MECLITEWKSHTIKLDPGKKERAVRGELLTYQAKKIVIRAVGNVTMWNEKIRM